MQDEPSLPLIAPPLSRHAAGLIHGTSIRASFVTPLTGSHSTAGLEAVAAAWYAVLRVSGGRTARNEANAIRKINSWLAVQKNRRALVDERRSHLDLQIKLLSEQENTKMLQLLREIAEKLGVNPGKDRTAAALEQATQPDKLVEQIERTITQTESRK